MQQRQSVEGNFRALNPARKMADWALYLVLSWFTS